MAVNNETLCHLRQEAARLASERCRMAGSLEAQLRRIGMNRQGGKLCSVDFLDQHLTGRAKAIEKSLPGTAQMKTEEQRKEAFAKAGRALDRALASIDDNANAVLANLCEEAGIVLEPLSVRELAALQIPPETAIEQSADGAGGVGMLLLGGAAFLLSGAWMVVIPVAILGWIIGRTIADTTKEIEEFRRQLAGNIDGQLEKLRPLLAIQFDARVDELQAAIETKLNALSQVPSAGEELKLREDLAIDLQKL